MTAAIFIIGFSIIATVSAYLAPGAKLPTAFTVKYFSDGTCVAVIEGDMLMSGTWNTGDGFFVLLDRTAPKTEVGTCTFNSDNSYVCAGNPRTYIAEDGSQAVSAGARFRGTRYSGRPGRRITTSRSAQIAN